MATWLSIWEAPHKSKALGALRRKKINAATQEIRQDSGFAQKDDAPKERR